MSAWVWVNVMLGVPFLLAWVGIPLWMTFNLRYLQDKDDLAGKGVRVRLAVRA